MIGAGTIDVFQPMRMIPADEMPQLSHLVPDPEWEVASGDSDDEADDEDEDEDDDDDDEDGWHYAAMHRWRPLSLHQRR